MRLEIRVDKHRGLRQQAIWRSAGRPLVLCGFAGPAKRQADQAQCAPKQAAPHVRWVDRIRQVTRRRQEVVAKGLPGLDEALGNGQLRFYDKGEIALTLCFAQNAEGQALCDIYRETPMAPDQRILTLADGSMELQATVMYSLQLVRMLQAEAHRSRVLQPTALKNEIVAFVKAAAGLHL